jgi:hypothetical protein
VPRPFLNRKELALFAEEKSKKSPKYFRLKTKLQMVFILHLSFKNKDRLFQNTLFSSFGQISKTRFSNITFL